MRERERERDSFTHMEKLRIIVYRQIHLKKNVMQKDKHPNSGHSCLNRASHCDGEEFMGQVNSKRISQLFMMMIVGRVFTPPFW